MLPDKRKPNTNQGSFQPYKSEYCKADAGGIYQLGDHLWESKYSPQNAHGKRISRKVYAKTREECEEKIAIMIQKEMEKLIAKI